MRRVILVVAALTLAVTEAPLVAQAPSPRPRLTVPYTEFTLANGLHVILHRDASVPIVGITPGAVYDFPFDVTINLGDVGGPSAGTMLALGVYDKLTPGELTGGERIAGTGTIAADGEVGAIGGIRQKMYGASGAGAEWFLAPASNCEEVVGHIPDGLDFVEVAPVLCAGVTVYKGLKVTDTKPGDWVVISGIGGLGHMAVQYARAMGLNVAAVDIDDAKLALARKLGAAVTVNATLEDPAAAIRRQIGGGAQGVLVTAVSPPAFQQALGMVARGGTVALVGLPPGDFPLPIFDVVLGGITVRGSIVGTRLDLQESLEFARDGKVRAMVASAPLERINQVFEDMHAGRIEGRLVLDMAL